VPDNNSVLAFLPPEYTVISQKIDMQTDRQTGRHMSTYRQKESSQPLLHHHHHHMTTPQRPMQSKASKFPILQK